jgi:hypothetical protein
MVWILRPTESGIFKKEKSYSKHSIILSSSETVIDQFFDFIDYDPLNTTADPSKVYILIDDDSMPFRLSDIAGTAVEGSRIRIRSEMSEWGKVLILILGREYRYFSTRGRVAIISDSAGLAKDATLSEISVLQLFASTTTPLAANATWISPTESDPRTGRVVGSVFADQAGQICVDQSPDGINWDVSDCFAVSDNQGLGFSVEKIAQYARVRYVNGAAAQTGFRLYVYRRLRVI